MGVNDCFVSNVNLSLPHIFKGRQCIELRFACLPGKRRLYTHISLRFRESCDSILHYNSMNKKIFWVNSWSKLKVYSHDYRLFNDVKIHGIYPNMKFHLKQNIHCRDSSKLTWLQMIGYHTYAVGYTYFGTLKRDSSENSLNLILELNDYIFTWLHVMCASYGTEKKKRMW